jgi:hypothetical protein
MLLSELLRAYCGIKECRILRRRRFSDLVQKIRLQTVSFFHGIPCLKPLKFCDLVQKICLQTVSFVTVYLALSHQNLVIWCRRFVYKLYRFFTVYLALSHQNVPASRPGRQSLNPSHSVWDIWWYREIVLNKPSPYHVTVSYQQAMQGDLRLLQECSNL